MSFPLRGGVAVISGAASGIGAALAQALAQRGCDVALVDVNASGLAEVARRASERGVVASEHPLDVAQPEAVAALPKAVLARHGRVSVLINNAGVALSGRFDEVSLEDLEWLFAINFWGVVRMTRAFLPLLRREPIAQVVNISSLFGIIAPPGQVAYAASKFAVRGFSEALRHELAQSSLGLTVVHPGGVATSIAKNARRGSGVSEADSEQGKADFSKLLRLSPEAAAARIILGIERREPRVLIGGDARRADLVQRLFPARYWALIQRSLAPQVEKEPQRASWQAHLAALLVRWQIKRRLADMDDIGRVKAVFESGRFPLPPDVRFRPERLGAVDGERVDVDDAPRPTLLYLHGGGFVACSARTHRPITAAFAKRGFRVFAPDYRLAPANPFPAAVEDVLSAWQALRNKASGRLVVAGDSAGGNLALALMLKLRDAGAGLPAAAALFSPATDLAGTGASISTNSRRDAMFRGPALQHLTNAYLAGADPRDPLASPLYADLKGLPPLLIHVGEREVLRDDSTRLAARAGAAGVHVDLEVWPVVPHVWQFAHRLVPEARRSLAMASEFLLRPLAEPAREAEMTLVPAENATLA